MQTKLVIWDFNGCLLNDLQCFYDLGVCYIFNRFGLKPPTMEQYRNEVHTNFMEFYWTHGIPLTETADSLDSLIDESLAITPYTTEVFPEVPAVLAAIQTCGIDQVIVSGCPQPIVERVAQQALLTGFFSEIRGSSRNKIPVYREVMERRGLFSFEVVGVTDTDGDVKDLATVGIKPYACPRGYHGLPRLVTAQSANPTLEIVPDLNTFLNKLR
jgi:phosphoglycolate phosphatase-like HAD superfamily hydrolase